IGEMGVGNVSVAVGGEEVRESGGPAFSGVFDCEGAFPLVVVLRGEQRAEGFVVSVSGVADDFHRQGLDDSWEVGEEARAVVGSDASTFHEAHEREVEVGDGRAVFPAGYETVVEVLASLDPACPEMAARRKDLHVVHQALEVVGFVGFDVARVYEIDVTVDYSVYRVLPRFLAAVCLGAGVSAVVDELSGGPKGRFVVEMQDVSFRY